MKTASCFAALLLIPAAMALGQPTKAQVLNMALPPPSFEATKTLQYTGDYGYFYLGSTVDLSNSTDFSNPAYWHWADYQNPWLLGNIWAWGSPADDRVCNHGHISWGLWGKLTLRILGHNIVLWKFLGGGTQSGEKLANGTCAWNVDNPFSRFAGEDFGWGQTYVNQDSRNTGFKYPEFILGAVSVSHGAGLCGVFQCGHPVWSILYTLP